MDKYILLSIQPKIVQEIIDGDKTFEFRKKFPNITENSQINKKVVIYSSTPTMQIIGSFVIGSYYHSDFNLLMEKVNATNEYKKRISNYFTDKTSCHALEITKLKIYKKPLELNYLRENFKGFVPGQSYRYLDNKIVEDIITKNGFI
mgnify:CR=1 FL=1